MGEAKRRLNLAGEKLLPKNPKQQPSALKEDLPMVQIIPNQTAKDDLLIQNVKLAEVFRMSDDTLYIFDRLGTLHKLYSRRRKKE